MSTQPVDVEIPANPPVSQRTWGIVLVALTMLAYLPVPAAGFIWDDDSYILHNPSLRTLTGLWRIWTDHTATPQYYPLVHTSFWIEFHLWQLSPLPYHAVNLLLHATSAVLLWRLLAKLALPGAYAAAVLFAVHPVNVESVAWITERKNVLSTVFYLLAMGRILFAVAPDVLGEATVDHGQRQRSYAGGLLFFAFALLSKTVTSTLPAAALVIVWWKRGRLTRRDGLAMLPLFAMGLAAGSFTGYLERTQVGARGPEFTGLTAMHRVLIAGRAVAHYAGTWVWPVRLAFIYPRWTIDPQQMVQWLFPLGVTIVVLSLWALRRRVGRGPLAGVLLFIGSLTPALGFVNVYPMRYSFVADHFMYLATLPAAALSAAALTRIPRPAGRIVLIAIALVCAGLTFAQARIYSSTLTLWRDTIAKNPTSWMAHTNLAHALVADNQQDAAWDEYRRALELAPNVTDPHINVGSGLATRGDIAGAQQQFEQALAIDPHYLSVYGLLAKLQLLANKPAEAERWARFGLAAAPNEGVSHLVMGFVLEAEKNVDGAMAEYRKAIELQPRRAEAYVALAGALLNQKRRVEAMPLLQMAVTLDPTDAPSWARLGTLQMSTGKPDDAAYSFEQALANDPKQGEARFGLSMLKGAGRGP